MWTVTHTGNSNKYDVEFNGTFMASFPFWNEAEAYIIDQEKLFSSTIH